MMEEVRDIPIFEKDMHLFSRLLSEVGIDCVVSYYPSVTIKTHLMLILVFEISLNVFIPANPYYLLTQTRSNLH